MSNLEIEGNLQAMREGGELEFIQQHLAAARGEAPAPADEADTVEDAEATEDELQDTPEAGDSAEPDDSADGGTEDEAESDEGAEDDDIVYLDLDPAVQALIDSKYGGDLGKALEALAESQSMIGRQSNEVGQLRQQLEELKTLVERGQTLQQPYPEWPDEMDDPDQAGLRYREIAEEAFNRQDVDMFSRAVDVWQEMDPVGAINYRDLKILQLQTAVQAPAPAAAPVEATLANGLAVLREKYPQFTTDAFQAEIGKELEKFPALKGLLWGEIPGTTPEQRLAALEETIVRVASRQTDETAQQALRRVAVKRSEEARRARAEAKVTSGSSARETEEAPTRRTVPLGTTGLSLDLDRVAQLSGEDINT